MIEFKSPNKPRIAILLDDTIEVTFTTSKYNLKALSEIPSDKELNVQVKEFKPKRTYSQNSYLWVLLSMIGQKMTLSKEEVYRSFLKDYGVFEILPIRNEAVESFIYKWGKNGLGWFCEELGESKLDGYTKLIAYYGSSTYTTSEMKKLIDAVVQACEEYGIQTMTAREIAMLKNDND